VSLRSLCFSDKEAKCFRGVFQETLANRPLAVDKATYGPFVYAEAPRGSGDPAKHLDTMGKVVSRVLH